MRRTDTTKIRRKFLRFRREDGNSTIEFVILFPIFMLLFISAFEIGLLMVRQVMLDRATDMVVRTLRLGQWDIPDGDTPEAIAAREQVHENMKTAICDAAAILPGCQNNLLIELSEVSTDTWAPLPADTSCIDKSAEVNPLTTFRSGQQNELMMVRVCALQQPLFPLSGLGAMLPRVDDDHYALISMTAFVNEPS